MRTLEQIDAFIESRAQKGTRPSDIATNLGLTAVFVRDRMAVLGFEVRDGSHLNKFNVHPMWDAETHERRHWIWKRQHDGAVQALRRIAHA